jgi:hypothetical protein
VRFIVLPVALALGIVLSACSGTQPQGAATCNVVYNYPNVQLIYPIPGTTNLPVGLTTLLYDIAPNNGSTRATVPITLRIGATAPIATKSVPIPNPAPSPTATATYGNSTTAAVALPRLSATTTYEVFATQYEDQCGVKTGKTLETDIGSFATQSVIGQ